MWLWHSGVAQVTVTRPSEQCAVVYVCATCPVLDSWVWSSTR